VPAGFKLFHKKLLVSAAFLLTLAALFIFFSATAQARIIAAELNGFDIRDATHIKPTFFLKNKITDFIQNRKAT